DRLAEDSAAWRRAIFAATERVVLAVPSTIAGEATAPHPIWDEIAGVMRLAPADVAKVRRNAADVLASHGVDLAPLALPAARSTWSLRRSAWSAEQHFSATSLETLIKCP